LTAETSTSQLICSVNLRGQDLDSLSLTDRGYHYGDGLFETIAIVNGQICLWDQHATRLCKGCRHLGLEIPDRRQMKDQVDQLASLQKNSVVKILISAAGAGRGYRRTDNKINCSMHLYEWPDSTPIKANQSGIRIRICDLRLSQQPALAGLKHLNRLENVLAATELAGWNDSSISEGLLFDHDNHLIEGISSNVFIKIDRQLFTPQLDRNGIDGVVRQLLMATAEQMGAPVSLTRIGREMLEEADAVYLTNSIRGVQHVGEIVNLKHFTAANADHPVISQVKELVHTSADRPSYA